MDSSAISVSQAWVLSLSGKVLDDAMLQSDPCIKIVSAMEGFVGQLLVRD